MTTLTTLRREKTRAELDRKLDAEFEAGAYRLAVEFDLWESDDRLTETENVALFMADVEEVAR